MNQRDQDREATRQRFIDTAYELFRAQGYGTTSMNQIAKQAGGSRANLYLHFRNKPDLMLAKMREIEPALLGPISSIFELPRHDLGSVLGWLRSMRELWLEHAVEFSAIEQAMAEDETVAGEWLGMMRRLSSQIPQLSEDEDRRVQFTVSLMSMDRNFYFLYVRNHAIHEEKVHRALAQQWLNLFPGGR